MALRSMLIFVGLQLAFASDGESATYHVPSDYSTIQSGIDAASSGDSVVVAAGDYSGDGNRDLRVNGKRIWVIAPEGPEATSIDCGGTADEPHRGFLFTGGESRETVVSGFLIEFGFHLGGGMRFEADSSPTVEGCVFQYNGCIYAYQGELSVAGNALQVRGASAPLISGCRFVLNGYNGEARSAVYVTDDARPEFEDCFFYWNEAGGVYADENAQMTFRRCSLLSNRWPYYGGAIFSGSTLPVIIEDCIVAGNGADRAGGGVFAHYATIRGSIIAHNEAAGLSATGWGGGLVIMYSGRVEHSIVWGNCAEEEADVCAAGAVEIVCCVIDSTGCGVESGGSITYEGPSAFSDPMFCDPYECRPSSGDDNPDYSLRSDSPALPEFSPCGQLIGALGLGCSAPSPVGACCLEDGACVLLSSEDCLAQGGLFTEEGAGCFPDPCHSSVVETGTWGQIKARFR